MTRRLIGHDATISAPHMVHPSNIPPAYALTHVLSNNQCTLSKINKNKNKQHAHAAELLLPYLHDRPDGRTARVLDVGAGSGYLTSVLYHLVRNDDDAQQQRSTSTLIVGIEHIPVLTELAQRNIRADGLSSALDSQGIVLVTGDGRLGAHLFPSFSSFLLKKNPQSKSECVL